MENYKETLEIEFEEVSDLDLSANKNDVCSSQCQCSNCSDCGVIG